MQMQMDDFEPKKKSTRMTLKMEFGSKDETTTKLAAAIDYATVLFCQEMSQRQKTNVVQFRTAIIDTRSFAT